MNLADMDTARLKKTAKKYDVKVADEWDDEEIRSAIRKAKKKLKNGASTEEHTEESTVPAVVLKRAETVPFEKASNLIMALDPDTKQKVAPLECRGWFYDEKDAICASDCPHREPCAKLTKAWEKAAGGPEAIAKLESYAEATAESREVKPADAKEAVKTAKPEKTEAKPEKAKKSKQEDDEEGETLAAPTVKRLKLTSKLKLGVSEEDFDGIEDDTNRKLYKRIFKRHGTKVFLAEEAVDILLKINDVEEASDDDKQEVLTELVQPLIDSKELVRA